MRSDLVTDDKSTVVHQSMAYATYIETLCLHWQHHAMASSVSNLNLKNRWHLLGVLISRESNRFALLWTHHWNDCYTALFSHNL